MANLQSLREALRQSPNNIPLLLLHANCCLEEGEVPSARESFSRLLELDPQHLDAKLGLARTYYLEGSHSEAAVRFERLLQEKEDFAPAHLYLSRIYLSENDRQQAYEHYKKALSISKQLSDPAIEKELGGELVEALKGNSSEEKKNQAHGSEKNWFFPLSERDDSEESDSYSLFDESEAGMDPDWQSTWDFQRPQLTFADVGGMDELKDFFRRKFYYPLKSPELCRAYGQRPGGGVLLYGPPGCGKTMVAHAVAGEWDLSLFAVGYHHIFDMETGGCEKNLHHLFRLAQENAPSLLLFDGIEALLSEDQGRNGSSTLLHQLLNEMDNAGSGVFWIATSRAPWLMDLTLMRPGRFDYSLYVPPPVEPERRAIIELCSQGKPIVDIDPVVLAHQMRRYSGADIKAVFDRAVERAMTRAVCDGEIVPLNMDMILEVIEEHRPSTLSWLEQTREFRRYFSSRVN